MTGTETTTETTATTTTSSVSTTSMPTTTTAEAGTTEKERIADLSSSYDELMQTVIWVPPATETVTSTAAAAVTDVIQTTNVSAVVDDNMGTPSGNDAKDGAAKVSTSTSKNPSTISTTAVIGSVEESATSNRFSSSDVHLQQQQLTSFSTVAIERNVFEMAEAFRKGVMVEIETMKGLCFIAQM